MVKKYLIKLTKLPLFILKIIINGSDFIPIKLPTQESSVKK